MKVNPQADELLSAFLDGELSPRQQTEVHRMAAHDPDMAQRLQQLRGCRTLINVLPRAEAPADMIEQINQSLERRSLLDERSILTSTHAGVRTLKMRRFLAAAAMIALVGVLGVVVYQIVSPVPSGPSSNWVASSETPVPVVQLAAESPFSGRLELSTASLTQAANLISASALDNNLGNYVKEDPSGTRMICRIVGSREKLEAFLTDLSAAGQNFKSARLIVETDRFADSVIVDSVTLPQVAGILNRNTTEGRVQAAKDTAMLNRFAREMPGREIQVATSQNLDNAFSELSAPLKPRLAQGKKDSDVTTPLKEEEQVKASLTIVLLSTQ
jgi:hypothetical protein